MTNTTRRIAEALYGAFGLSVPAELPAPATPDRFFPALIPHPLRLDRLMASGAITNTDERTLSR